MPLSLITDTPVAFHRYPGASFAYHWYTSRLSLGPLSLKTVHWYPCRRLPGVLSLITSFPVVYNWTFCRLQCCYRLQLLPLTLSFITGANVVYNRSRCRSSYPSSALDYRYYTFRTQFSKCLNIDRNIEKLFKCSIRKGKNYSQPTRKTSKNQSYRKYTRNFVLLF